MNWFEELFNLLFQPPTPIRQAQGPPIRQAQGPPIRQAQGPPIRQAQGPAPLPESKVKPYSRFIRFQFLLLEKCRGLLNGSKQ